MTMTESKPAFYDFDAPNIDLARFKTQFSSGLLSAGLDVQYLEDGLFGLALRVGCAVADQAYLVIAPYFGAGDAYKLSHGYDTDRNSVLVVVLHGEHNTNPVTGYTSWEDEEEYSEWVDGLDAADYVAAALKLVEEARADGMPI
jgi:hypothetical protein